MYIEATIKATTSFPTLQIQLQFIKLNNMLQNFLRKYIMKYVPDVPIGVCWWIALGGI